MKPVIYSVVIPVFNSSNSLVTLVTELLQVLQQQLGQATEILLVDDGSDNTATWQTIVQLARAHPEVRGIQLSQNYGKQVALNCGFREAQGQYIITLDDDLQHDPSFLPFLIAQQHHDVVIARFKSVKAPVYKKALSALYQLMISMLHNKPAGLRFSPYKLISRNVVENMLALNSASPSVAAQLLQVTRDIVNVELPHRPRAHGQSGFTWAKMAQALNFMLTGNKAALAKRAFSFGLVLLIGTAVYRLFQSTLLATDSAISYLCIASFVTGAGFMLLGAWLKRYQKPQTQSPPFQIKQQTDYGVS